MAYSDKYAKAMETAREKGRAAKRAGLGVDACPYPDTRKPCGRLTFSRHWRRLWLEGFRSA